MDLGVKDKNYIIVGGSKGMGWAASQTMAKDGANLAIISRTADACRERAKELASEYGIRAIGLGADASKPGEVEAAIESAISELGNIRGLLTAPGSTNNNGTLLEMSEEDWTANFHDVLMSQVRSCKAILPHMLDNGGGNLVTTAAYSARAPKDFLFGYATLKAGLINFTKNIAKTYGGQGIRANCVCPGAVETGALEKSRKKAAERYPDISDDKLLAHFMVNDWKMPVALARLGKPEELGDMMAFLLSERAGYATGAIVNVDGGSDF